MRQGLARRAVLRGKRKAYMEELRSLERANKEEISAWQQTQLDRVLSDARKNIPYYRDRATGNSLSDFPILTRNTIKNHRDELIVPSRINKKTITDTTSGTTNVPVSFLLDREHRDRGAMQKMLFNEWAGLNLGEPMIKFWGIFPAKTWSLRVKTDLSHWIRNMTLMDAVYLRADKLETYAETILKTQPKLMLGYSTTLFEFANYLKQNGIKMDYHGIIMSSASTLSPEKYEAIHSVFQCPIFDRYGSREMIDMACDCDHHEGLHVSPYMHVVEILNEDGEPCPPGQMGRVVVTQLFNPVMPLIRYDLGDYATWAEEECSCGINWPMLKQIDGRALGLFKHRDGGRVASYYFIYHVNRIIGQERIRRQQVIQEDYNRFTIRLDMTDPQRWKDREANCLELKALIDEMIGEEAVIEFELVDEIPLSTSGKYMQCITKIP